MLCKRTFVCFFFTAKLFDNLEQLLSQFGYARGWDLKRCVMKQRARA